MAVKKMSSLPSGMSQSRDKRTYREIIALVLDKEIKVIGDKDKVLDKEIKVLDKGIEVSTGY